MSALDLRGTSEGCQGGGFGDRCLARCGRVDLSEKYAASGHHADALFDHLALGDDPRGEDVALFLRRRRHLDQLLGRCIDVGDRLG